MNEALHKIGLLESKWSTCILSCLDVQSVGHDLKLLLAENRTFRENYRGYTHRSTMKNQPPWLFGRVHWITNEVRKWP